MQKILKHSLILVLFGVIALSSAFGQVRTIADRADTVKLKKAVADFRKPNQLPGISVAIIKDGEMIFKHGAGIARSGIKADGDTVYHAASVSKVIAGTLAVKLLQNRKLEDGTKIQINLNSPTSSYLKNVRQTNGKVVSLPSGHKHSVKQLFSHLACIKGYEGIEPTYKNYPKAIDALPAIWNQGFVPDCSLGVDWNYSTHAFTYIAAVLEKITGKTAAQLVRSEIAIPHNLPTLESSWENGRYSNNRKLADHFEVGLKPVAIKPKDNSWKVFGGGLQISTVDLARFGWKVRSGEIVRAARRDNILWKRVNPSKAYGIGWRLVRRDKWRVAEHSGKWRGVRTNLRVYRDKNAPIVIAVMTNRETFLVGNDLNTLTDSLAKIVLKIRRIR